jgi:hypothetical protein
MVSAEVGYLYAIITIRAIISSGKESKELETSDSRERCVQAVKTA